MKRLRNIGALDRALRIMFGSAMLLAVPLAFVGPASQWALLGLFGVIPLAAGLLGYCPPYAMMGIDTYHGGARAGGESVLQSSEPVAASEADHSRC